MLNEISGGVCAARGFQAAGVHCGVKASSSPDKNDLALILSERECDAAAVYTLNRVRTEPPGVWWPTAATPMPAAL